MATFSDVASAWKSTKMMRASSRTASMSASTPVNGSSICCMNTRPMALMTATGTPLSAVATTRP